MSAAGTGGGQAAAARGTVAGSGLVRLLRGWGVAESPPARQDFAERLSLWLGPTDAMRLRALQPSLRPPLGAPGPALETQRLAAACAVAQQAWVGWRQRIAVAGRFEPEGDDPVPRHEADAPGFAPYRLAYLDWQRELDAGIGTVRAQLRQALAREAAWRPLATLDAVLEPMTAARANKLWGLVPQCLEQRFRHWRDAGPPGGGADAPRAWLAHFEADWTAALLAELDARWEPVQGLMDAWRNEIETRQ